mgnify:CR=1 FL=1
MRLKNHVTLWLGAIKPALSKKRVSERASSFSLGRRHNRVRGMALAVVRVPAEAASCMTQEPVRLTGACFVMRAMLAGSVFASAELGKYSKRKAPSTPQGLCISCLVGEAKKEKRRVR